jgi:hypothetical protein
MQVRADLQKKACDELEFLQIVIFCFITACVFVVGLSR